MLTSLLNLLDSVKVLFHNCISQPTAVVLVEKVHTTHTSPLVHTYIN